MNKETPDLSGLLGNLLSNPGALSALSGILGNLGGQSERQPPPEEPTHTEKPEEKAVEWLLFAQIPENYEEKNAFKESFIKLARVTRKVYQS